MKWEIVGRKAADRKDTAFQVEAKTSAEAVSEAMSWGWTVKSFHEVGAVRSAGFRTLLLGMLSVVVLAMVGGGVFLALRSREASEPTRPSAIVSQHVAEPSASDAVAGKTATPSTNAPTPTAVAPPVVTSAHNAPPTTVEASAMFESLPGTPELLISAAQPAGLAPTTSPARALTPAAVTAAQVKYVASKLAGPFHLPGCQSAQRISGANLQTFDTREAAVAAGHEPCKVCRP